LAVILPGILGVIILMITIYSIGSELKWKTSREWLAVGGDNFALSMIGKLLPHTILYSILGISLNILMFRILDFPVMGSLLWLNVGMFLYVLAMEGLAICFIGLVPVLRDALSVGGLIGMLSFSLSGFTFPAMGMLSWAQSIIYLFPLRHYYLIYVNEALMGDPITTSAVYMAAYVGFMILPFLVGKRLENALRLQNYPRD
jgi:ABC-2 type transport system permease protein